MRLRSLLALGLAATLPAGSAAAHHSFSAVFDVGQTVEITGTVARIEWMNPHVWIYLKVANDDGAFDEWAFEMGSPNRLLRYGWNPQSLPEGATVTIAGSRARDGSLKAAVDTVTLPNGRRLFGAQETSQ
jgi:hypothetical protein